MDDILISLKSNPKHTEAVMEISDLKTGENKKIDYKISKKSGKFSTEVYIDGKLTGPYVTDYDPLEPGATSEVLKNSKIDDQATIQAYYYRWDNVYFANGYGIKYPHPDYQYYWAEAWQNFYINGNQLYHYHIDLYTSTTIARLAPVAAGAAIGSRVGGVYGAVVGACLGLYLGGVSSSILLDERGSIWYWYAKSWGWTVLPISPYLYYYPKYFRISSYTLWNGLGIGNP